MTRDSTGYRSIYGMQALDNSLQLAVEGNRKPSQSALDNAIGNAQTEEPAQAESPAHSAGRAAPQRAAKPPMPKRAAKTSAAVAKRCSSGGRIGPRSCP